MTPTLEFIQHKTVWHAVEMMSLQEVVISTRYKKEAELIYTM